jgi:hypothetical protein
MRFALMIEPQQGLSYVEQLDLAAGRTARLRGPSDPTTTAASPARRTSRPPTPGRSWRASRARPTHPAGHARLAGHVPPSRIVRQGRDHGRRDERRSGRCRCRRGLERSGAQPAGPGIPRYRRTGRSMEDELAILHGLWEEPDGWSFEGKQVSGSTLVPPQAGPAAASADHRRAARAARDRCAWPLATPTSTTCPLRPGPVRAKFALLDAECRKIGRDPATMRKSVMVGFLDGADEAEFERRVHDLLAMVGEAGTDAAAWLDEHRPRWIVGTRSGPGHGRSVRRHRSGTDHAPGHAAARSRHDRADRPRADRPDLRRAARDRRVRAYFRSLPFDAMLARALALLDRRRGTRPIRRGGQ